MRLLALCLLLLPGSVWGQELTIQGEAREHKRVIIKSEVAGKWLALGPNSAVRLASSMLGGLPVLGSPALNFADIEADEDGKGADLVGAPGFYAVIQYVAEEQKPRVLVVEILPAEDIPPGPGPKPPGPKPVILPDGTYKFARLAYDSVALVPEEKRYRAAGLAKNYADAASSIRSAVAAGTVPNTAEALANLFRENRVTLGSDPVTGIGGDREAWLPWFLAWQEHGDAAGLVPASSPAVNYATAFEETATGLRAIK